MEVGMRKLEAGAKLRQETTAAALTRIKADLTTLKSNDVTHTKWAIKHDAQIEWATSKIWKGDDEKPGDGDLHE